MKSVQSAYPAAFLRRRTVLSMMAGGAAMAVAPGILANTAYPTRPIRVINGFPPGGAIDSIFRVIAKNAETILGQTIIVENVPGAGGTVGIVKMKNAAADGYTLGILTMGVFRAPVTEDVAYDPIKDITYIVNLSEVPFGIVVRADSPFKTWADLIKFGKENPQRMNYGAAAGLGNSAHMLMEEVAGQEGVKWNVIPYKGGPDTQQALLAGDIVCAVDGSGSFGPFVDSGKTRLLAMASVERSPKWPDVPTTTELGYRAKVDSPWGLGGPRGLDPKVIQTVQDAFLKSMAFPEVRSALVKSGQSPRVMNHKEFTDFASRALDEQRALLTKYGFAKKR